MPTPIDALVANFELLREQSRKPSADAAALILKMGKVVVTAKDTLPPPQRKEFRARVGLDNQNTFTMWCAVGTAYPWLKPHVKALPPYVRVLLRIAQRLTADTVTEYIENGTISPFMSHKDALRLPLKHPTKGCRGKRTPPQKLRFVVMLRLPTDTCDAHAAARLLSKLTTMLSPDVQVTTSDHLTTLLRMNGYNENGTMTAVSAPVGLNTVSPCPTQTNRNGERQRANTPAVEPLSGVPER